MDRAQSSCSKSDNDLCAGDREQGQAAEAACKGLAVPGALPGNECAFESQKSHSSCSGPLSPGNPATVPHPGPCWDQACIRRHNKDFLISKQRAKGAGDRLVLLKGQKHAGSAPPTPALQQRCASPPPPHQELPVCLREPERGGAGDRWGPHPVRGDTDSRGLRRAQRLSPLVWAARWPPLELGEPHPTGPCVTLAPGGVSRVFGPVCSAGSVSCSEYQVTEQRRELARHHCVGSWCPGRASERSPGC